MQAARAPIAAPAAARVRLGGYGVDVSAMSLQHNARNLRDVTA